MVRLDLRSEKPIYEQIVEQIKMGVVKGYLKPKDAIPSVRKLALELGITPGTVAKAYQELERFGIIETIRGKGTFITEQVDVRVDDSRISDIKKRMKSELLELKMMGYDTDDVLKLVRCIYEELT